MWQAARRHSVILILSATTALGGCAGRVPRFPQNLDLGNPSALLSEQASEPAPFDSPIHQTSAAETLLEDSGLAGPDQDFSTDASGEPQRVMNLSIGELLEFARRQHPLLGVHDEEILAARAQVDTAATRDNPELVVDIDTPIKEAGTTEVSMRIMFPYHTASKLERRRDVAVAGVHQAHLLRDVEEATILAAAVDAASEVLYLQAVLPMQAKLADLARQRAQAIPTDVTTTSSGQLKFTDKIRAERDAAKFQLRQFESERELTVARLALARAIGAPPEWEIRLADDLLDPTPPLIPLAEVIHIAKQRSPAVAEALGRVAEGREAHSLARAESIPDFKVGPRYQDELARDGTDQIGARFSMDLPVWNRNESAIAEAQGTMRVNRGRMSVAHHEAANDAAALYGELIRVQQSLRAYRQQTDQLTARFEEISNDPTLRGLFSEEQKLDFRQQQAEQRLDELQLRQREYQLRHRLEVLLGQGICRA